MFINKYWAASVADAVLKEHAEAVEAYQFALEAEAKRQEPKGILNRIWHFFTVPAGMDGLFEELKGRSYIELHRAHPDILNSNHLMWLEKYSFKPNLLRKLQEITVLADNIVGDDMPINEQTFLHLVDVSVEMGSTPVAARLSL